MPKHIVRLILVLVGLVVFGLSAKAYFTVDSFYQFGHYRGDAVPMIAEPEPKYRGPGYCKQCHAERFEVWSTHGHKKTKCEVCHGPAGQHPATGKLPIPQDTRKLCTLCHQKITGRPAHQPQIVVEEHAGELQCLYCHDPHQPKPIRIKEAKQ